MEVEVHFHKCDRKRKKKLVQKDRRAIFTGSELRGCCCFTKQVQNEVT